MQRKQIIETLQVHRMLYSVQLLSRFQLSICPPCSGLHYHDTEHLAAIRSSSPPSHFLLTCPSPPPHFLLTSSSPPPHLLLTSSSHSPHLILTSLLTSSFPSPYRRTVTHLGWASFTLLGHSMGVASLHLTPSILLPSRPAWLPCTPPPSPSRWTPS